MAERQSNLFQFPTAERRVFEPAPRVNERRSYRREEDLTVKGAVGSCIGGGILAIAVDKALDYFFDSEDDE